MCNNDKLNSVILFFKGSEKVVPPVIYFRSIVYNDPMSQNDFFLFKEGKV